MWRRRRNRLGVIAGHGLHGLGNRSPSRSAIRTARAIVDGSRVRARGGPAARRRASVTRGAATDSAPPAAASAWWCRTATVPMPARSTCGEPGRRSSRALEEGRGVARVDLLEELPAVAGSDLCAGGAAASLTAWRRAPSVGTATATVLGTVEPSGSRSASTRAWASIRSRDPPAPPGPGASWSSARAARAAARPRPRSPGQLRPVPRHRHGPGMARRRHRGP